MNHELVRATEKNFGGQVPALFATEGTLDRDGLKRKLRDAGRHIAAALLACGHEQSPLYGWESECHSPSIGESKAKVIHRPGSNHGTCFMGAILSPNQSS